MTAPARFWICFSFISVVKIYQGWCHDGLAVRRSGTVVSRCANWARWNDHGGRTNTKAVAPQILAWFWHQTWKKSPESIFRVDMCPRCPTCLIWVKKVQFYPDRAKVHGHVEISVSRGWTKNLGRSRMRLERNEIQSHPKLKNLNCIGKLDFDIRHERKVQNLFLGWTCVHGVQLA